MDSGIRDDLIDELLKGYEKPENLVGESGLLKQLTKAILLAVIKPSASHSTGRASLLAQDAHNLETLEEVLPDGENQVIDQALEPLPACRALHTYSHGPFGQGPGSRVPGRASV